MPELSRRSMRRGGLPLCFAVATLAVLLTANLTGSAGSARAIVVPSPSAAPSAGNGTTYPVNFTVVGHPAGTPWNLTILQQSWATTGSFILLREANGTYPYTADSVYFTGERFANGSFVVAGHAVNISLKWAPPPTAGPGNATTAGPAGATFGGSLFIDALAVLFIGVVVAVGVAVRGKLGAVREVAAEAPLGAPGASLASRPSSSESIDDPLRHML